MRSLCSLVVLVLVLATAPPAAGSMAPGRIVGWDPAGATGTGATWTSTTSGPALIWDATAFAASTGRLVHFGGTTGYASPTSTRLLDPRTGTWTTLDAPRRGWPAARTLARMAYDPVHKRVIMFGGRVGSTSVQETWAFDPAARTWTQLGSCRTAACPPARYAHGMVWSAALSRIVVFGGVADTRAGQVIYNDLWTFDGTRWAPLKVAGAPAARYLFGMAEDATSGRLLVFGGLAGGSDRVVDTATWILDPVAMTWTRRSTPTVPAPRTEVGMAWLGSIGAVVVSTGGDGTTCLSWTDSTWAYDMTAGDWRKVVTTGGPPTARNGATLVANPADGSAVLIGGTHDNRFPITLADRAWILR